MADLRRPFAVAGLDGVLAEIIVGEKDTVPVGTIVALIAAPGEAVTKRTKAAADSAQTGKNGTAVTAAAASPAAAPQAAVSRTSPAVSSQAGILASRRELKDGFILASPLARKSADSLGINLAELRGTGPEGAVIARDLPALDTGSAYRGRAAGGQSQTAAAESAAMASGAYEDVDFTRIRGVAAERMTESWTTIPQFTLYDEADAGMILRIAERFKKNGEPVSLTVILAKLLAHAAAAHPLVNGSWMGGGCVRTYSSININIAMDTPDGLVVPVLRDCAGRGFKALGADMKALAEKAKTKSLAATDYEGGTITLSNLGMFGIKRFRAIVNPPQTAILAVGALSDKIVAVDKGFEARKFIEYSITADHRAIDGAYAARFMAALKKLIENPLSIMD